MGTDSAVGWRVSVCPALGSPGGEGSGHGAEAPAWQAGAALSSAATAEQGWGSSQSPETQHCHKPQQFQGETRRQSLSTGSAAQGCISKRSDRNSTRAPSSVRSVSSATGQHEFYSPRLSFARGDIKHQERNHNQRPGAAAAAISLFGASANSALSFPVLTTFHTWTILGGGNLPTGDFSHAPWGCSWERPPWFPNCFLSTLPVLGRCEFPPPALWASWDCSPFPRSVLMTWVGFSA